MPIHYALFENNVTADPDDYAAVVRVAWASRPPIGVAARVSGPGRAGRRHVLPGGPRPHLPLTWRDSGMSRVRGGTDLRTGRLDSVLTV